MKLCIIVMNSICKDPRVTKQISESVYNGIDVVAVGYKDSEYSQEVLGQLPCEVKLAEINDSFYFNDKRNTFKSITREIEKYRKTAYLIRKTKPDVIHANDLTGLIPAVMAARKHKCVIIYDSHEICTENNNLLRKPLKKAIMKILERYCIKKASLVVSVSHSAADILKKMYRLSDVMVVTNCSLKRDRPVIADIEKSNKFEVLIHGRFYRGRGYDVFVKSSKLSECDKTIGWVLRGFGPLEDTLKNYCAENKLDNIRFDPPVSVNELISSAAASHVGVAVTEPICMNFVHSVSNKIFEYASAGLPVIMSDISEHRYLNNKYNFGIILPQDTPEQLAGAVKKLKSDTELYNRLKENALKMSDELCWENEYGKLMGKYKSLYNGSD